MPKVNEQPAPLKPYFQHRVDIEYVGGSEAKGVCPFCLKEDKFFVNKDNGLYNCKVCGEKGNTYTFVRKIAALSSAPRNELEVVAEERRVHVETLEAWELSKSFIDQEWILPSYGIPKNGTSEVVNLYRWSPMKRKDGTYKRRLLATAELPTFMFGFQFWDQSKPDVYLTEGPWDGMKLWESFRRVRWEESTGRLVRTVDLSKSLYARCNVLSVPGAETFKEGWETPFSGKNVIVCYDNDHPKKNSKTGVIQQAGLDGMKKAVKRIMTVAKDVKVLLWGEEGYRTDLPDGYDVRDLLTSGA